MKGRYIFGIALILFGVLIFLDQIGLSSFGYIVSTFWPVIIIAVGISHLLSSNKSMFVGIAITSIGVLLQASELNLIQGGFWGAFFPLLLVLIGASILLSKRRSKWLNNRESTKDSINFYNILSGTKQKVESSNFMGGNVYTMFGGAQIDLRKASIAPEGAVLDLSCAFGGIEIKVPYGWNIVTAGTPILGALDNKTIVDLNKDNNNSPVLKINYFVIFGGIEIKN